MSISSWHRRLLEVAEECGGLDAQYLLACLIPVGCSYCEGIPWFSHGSREGGGGRGEGMGHSAVT